MVSPCELDEKGSTDDPKLHKKTCEKPIDVLGAPEHDLDDLE